MKEVLIARIKDLGSKEEKYNFVREYLQELALQIIDRHGYFKNLAFVGGTALRLLYDLPRFSEGLDFSLVNKKGFSFPDLLEVIKHELELNGFSVEEAKGREKTVLSEFIRFRGLLFELGLSPQKKEKLFIKLEIDSNPPEGYQTEVSLVNKNLLFKVRHYQPASLFASKLHAVLFRKYEKGRDYYDLLWLLARRTPIDYELLSAAAAQTEKRPFDLGAAETRELLLAKLAKVDLAALLRDIRPFLQDPAETALFRREYFIKAIEDYFSALGG